MFISTSDMQCLTFATIFNSNDYLQCGADWGAVVTPILTVRPGCIIAECRYECH